jgi:hypothetical protein
VVVMDELHMLDDENRGYLLELMATKILSLKGDDVQLIGMSATINVRTFKSNQYIFTNCPRMSSYLPNGSTMRNFITPSTNLCPSRNILFSIMWSIQLQRLKAFIRLPSMLPLKSRLRPRSIYKLNRHPVGSSNNQNAKNSPTS